MKLKLMLLCAILCAGYGVIVADEDETPDAVKRALRDVNQYIDTPLKLDDDELDWGWSLEHYEDLGKGCKPIDTPSMPSGMMMYDVYFTKDDATYHRRVAADDTFLIRCTELYPTQAGVLPYVTDALHEMNALLRTTHTLQDVTWTWEERWFTFDELGCGAFDDGATPHVKGYLVFLTLGEHRYEYRISEDRMVLSVCTKQGASVALKLRTADNGYIYHVGSEIPIIAEITNRGSVATEAPILLTITIPQGMYPTEVATEGREMDVTRLVEHIRDDSVIPGMDAETTRVATDGSLLLIAEENDDISMRYTFRLEPLPANATHSFTFLFSLQSEWTGDFRITGKAKIADDDFSGASGSKHGA